jgi:capsular polysaccharide biosynthesis protein
MNVFDQKISLGPVAKMYIKNWKLIILTVIACTTMAAVASMFITPRYYGKASFFIPYSISYDLALENPQFGYDVEADRLLQILNSEQLKDSLTQQFDMIKYFKIDTSDFDWKDQLSGKYSNRIVCSRTNAMSIVITAETHDPRFSAEIVKYILNISQRIRERMLKTNSAQAVESYKKDYLKKTSEVDSLRIKIINLRKGSNASPIALVNSQLLWGNGNNNSTNAETSVEIEVLTQKYLNEHNRLNELKGKYENALNVFNRPVPKFYMLDQPVPIFKKVFPLIGFNIAVAFLGSLFFMIAGFYLQYVIKSFKQNASFE